MKIGFIGQGWIGKNYADDFEKRGFEIVRYSLEEQYIHNKSLILECSIVFVAVPTPTTPKGFDVSYVLDALTSIKKGSTAVIKSTLTPGTTEELQKNHPDVYILHSPEFLVEKTAAYDAAHPNRNIIGIPIDNETYREKAEEVLKILPDSPYEKVMSSRDAELVKYAGNCFLFTKVIFINLLYDLITSSGSDFELVRGALVHDPRIGESHTSPIIDGKRGAGGHCFIKDFEAFRRMYHEATQDEYGNKVLRAMAEKNIQLLADSKKDLELLYGVYGDISKYKKS